MKGSAPAVQEHLSTAQIRVCYGTFSKSGGLKGLEGPTPGKDGGAVGCFSLVASSRLRPVNLPEHLTLIRLLVQNGLP